MSVTIPDSIPQKQCRSCEQFKSASKEFFTAVPAYISPDLLNRQCKICRNAQRKIAKKRIKPQDGYRRCSLCKNEYPLTIEHFHVDNGRNGGLTYVCRVCRKDYVQSLAEKREPIPDGYQKECASCQTLKSAVEFSEHPTTRDGLNATCRDCVSIYGASYYNKKAAQNGKNGKNKTAQIKLSQEEQREKTRKYQREYARSERGKLAHSVSNHKRTAFKKAIPGTLTSQQIQIKLKAQCYACYYCFTKFEKINGKYVYHLEHTIPLSRTDLNPRHDPNFTVLACSTCNLRKHNRAPWEWPEGGRLL